MDREIPIVTKVRACASRALRVRFAGDRHDCELDLTGLFARSQHFAPLLEDPKAFAEVEIVDDGIGVAWPIDTKWGRLDLSSSTLRRIAEEQTPVRGADFALWREELGLSLSEAAKLLGVGRRTIMSYLKKMNCRRWWRLPTGRWHVTRASLPRISCRPAAPRATQLDCYAFWAGSR